MKNTKISFFPGLYTNYLHFNGWLILTNYKASTKVQEILWLTPMTVSILLAPPYIIFQIISFFKLKFDLVTCSEIICMLLPLILCQIKIFTFLYHRCDIGDLLQLLHNDLFAFSSDEARARGNKILKMFVKKTNRFVFFFVVLELLPMTVWECIPLFASNSLSGNTTTVVKFLPGWYPWDYTQFPGYYLTFFYETNMACFNSFYQLSSNVLFYQLILMLCGHIAVLTDSFESLQQTGNTEDMPTGMKLSHHNNSIVLKPTLLNLIHKDGDISSSLKLAVENHQKILRLAGKLNKVYSVLVAADILLGLFLFCLILFQLTSVPEKQSAVDIIKSLSFIGSAGSFIFIECWLGSELEKMSDRLQNGVFNSGWPSRSERLNNCLPLILLVTSRPLKLSAGNTYPANLELFTSTMSFAYSFYTLLVNMQRG